MIVQPRDPLAPWPESSLPASSRTPLTDLLSGTTPKVREALLLTVRTLALKSAQRLDGAVYYLEVCPGYIATMGPSRWACREAWSLLLMAGWIPIVSAEDARARGARIAYALDRGWGQHVLLPETFRDELVNQTRAWMAAGILAPLAEGDPFASGDPGSEGWVTIVLGRPGAKAISCRCPFHDDRHPSARVFLNADGRTGGGRCMACVRQDGSGLTFAVRKSESGSWFARRSRPDAGAHATPNRSCTTNVSMHEEKTEEQEPVEQQNAAEKVVHPRVVEETIHADRHISRPLGAGGGWQTLGVLLRSLHQGLISSEAKLRGSLFDVLERANKRSLWKGQADKAWELSARLEVAGSRFPDVDRRMFLPDSLYHVSDMAETGHIKVDRVFRGRTVRVREVLGWRPWRQRRVLFDLDGLRWGSDGDVQTFAAAAVRWVRRRREFSGQVAVVMTSPTGLQIVAELTHARVAVTDWWKKLHVRSWYAKSAQALLKLARKHGAEGGIADLSSGAAGRLGRRPGWRLLKDGSPYRSHLVALEKRVVVRRAPRCPQAAEAPTGP